MGPRLPLLDGLRAVAVAVVIAFHAGFSRVPGDLGVAVFFVLSGFLITSLLLAEHDRTGQISLGRFYMRRTLRIFPAYYALVAATMLLYAFLGRTWTTGQTVSAVAYGVDFYIPFVGGPTHPINHAWSLSIEEQFYLIWPPCLVLLLRSGVRRVAIAVAVAVLAVASWRTVAVLGFGAQWSLVGYSLFSRVDTIAVGCLLALVVQTDAGLRLLKFARRSVWAAPLTAAAIVWPRLAASPRYLLSAGFTVEAILIAFLFVQLLANHRAVLWRWLDHRIARYLGRLSYSLYLWHSVAFAIAGRLHLPAAATLVAGLVASLAVAASCYYVVEQPFLRLKKRFETNARVQPFATTSATATCVRCTRRTAA
jgi:peptidoglycan/LPS O-acetylase OafA/YrhL